MGSMLFIPSSTHPAVFVPALVVIGQHLDDPAFAHLPVLAIVEHVPQLGAEKLQLGDAALDALQMPEDDPVRGLAGLLRLGAQAQELADRLTSKPSSRAWRMKLRRDTPPAP